jgi:hypothetical protein
VTVASEQKIDDPLEAENIKVARPVEGGTEHLEGLGRFIDDLLGDSRLRARTRAELEPSLLKEEEMPDDPAPSEPPPPVPEGTEDVTRGGQPGKTRR